ncbi:uncharacterized protein G2W53_040779 [Senna tora]|uniref:Uncharacterized protein n=1 Tax=Senna tora TaxID=362788 RepID=A0A834SDU4_9FABA|nr:uncharacterized protein G2W53_040779 [Senna tora]
MKISHDILGSSHDQFALLENVGFNQLVVSLDHLLIDMPCRDTHIMRRGLHIYYVPFLQVLFLKRVQRFPPVEQCQHHKLRRRELHELALSWMSCIHGLNICHLKCYRLHPLRKEFRGHQNPHFALGVWIYRPNEVECPKKGNTDVESKEMVELKVEEAKSKRQNRRSVVASARSGRGGVESVETWSRFYEAWSCGAVESETEGSD